MFREGYYLEIIKTKNSAATAVITVKEKTVELKSKKKTTTNKWLTIDDWASLYELLEKALLQNHKSSSASEKTKRTRHLEVSYTFEAPENPADRLSLPTIRVGVSPLRKKSRSKKTDALVFSCENVAKVEEYVPDGRSEPKIGYVPSRKSTLEFLQREENCNEYVPSVIGDDAPAAALYVPNSVPRASGHAETYEPCSLARDSKSRDEYIPNSKGLRKKVDEYQPDFTSKSMKFDDSYVPSSSKRIKELKKRSLRDAARGGQKAAKSRGQEAEKRSKDVAATEAVAGASGRKNSVIGQEIKREM